ncbi:hypothetical protein JCGZ_01871 [Jatropha curcas]|uniref:Uncharacterized protein n=1 Tax=Jatropha curcas TaxID=180498 RepID=A0A067L0X5_JATCU|nr:hypothetical protein JCGZ_01870 [Jatropha curcas]KDP42083.1 hypothetical protein JCGZ_01871 [Jatropha curcas]
MENNKKNNDSVGSSSSLGLIGSLKPFVKAGIASVTADISYLFIPIGAEWCIASRIKDEKLKKLLKSPEILKADLKEVSCGLLASVIGHSVTAPYITAKICMLADSHLPVEKHYRNVYDALYRISAKEGISALWTRNASLAIPFILSRTAVFASYHRSLGYFEGLFGSGGTRACLAAGAVSGFCDSVILKPSANINKRMRAMKPNSQGKYPYTSHLDCGLKILQSEGLFTLYKGYLRTIPRSIPQIMTMWLVLRKIQEFEEEFNREQVNGYIVD